MAVTRAAAKRIWNARAERHLRAQEELLRVLKQAIKDLSADYELRQVASVHGELKEFDSFYDKAIRYEKKGRVATAPECFEKIGDIVRARVTCQTLSDVERMQKLLQENDELLRGAVKVFDVKDRTGTGYRAVHLNTAINVAEGNGRVAVPCEIQLHTSLQLAWSFYTHKDFYKGEELPPLIRELMIQLSDLLNVADHVADHLIREVERLQSEDE